MAIPATPSNYTLQTANVTNLLSWNITAGATSYIIQSSLDGMTYSTLTTVTVTKYLDTAVTSGTQYWYKVAAVNATGTSPYTGPQTVVPAPTAEMSLLSLRLASKQKADLVGSQFVTDSEWNTFIDLAMYELYDLLIDADPELFMAPRAQFATNNNTFIYPLPNGLLSFTNQQNQSFIAAPFYKLLGVDLALNPGQNQLNAFVTLAKYNLIDRNKFLWPNSNSTLYGVFNMQYRLLGNSIEFIPTPSANQIIQLLYIPRLPQLLQDTDITTIGYSGWLQYVIVRAAKYALDKEESDTSKLDQDLVYLVKRIQDTAPSRDQGRPDTISDVRGVMGDGGNFSGNFRGGF